MVENEKQVLIEELQNQINILKKIQDTAIAEGKDTEILKISRQIQDLIGKIHNIESGLPFM